MHIGVKIFHLRLKYLIMSRMTNYNRRLYINVMLVFIYLVR